MLKPKRADLLARSFHFCPIPQNADPLGFVADKLHLSANYFGDLVKRETGKTAQEYIQPKLIAVAKKKIFAPGKTINEVAYEYGVQAPQHFTRFFKPQVGASPNEHRRSLN